MRLMRQVMSLYAKQQVIVELIKHVHHTACRAKLGKNCDACARANNFMEQI